MTPTERSELIARYAEGHAAVIAALDRIGPDRLDTVPPDGSWTPRMVVHHLADSEMTSALRVRKLLAEENVAIVGYPEEIWAKRAYYDRPIEHSLDAIKAARATTLDILVRMTEEEWQRPGTHNEIGLYTPEVWLGIYSRHCHEHAEQMLRAMG
ncbi:MAG: DinB family protein [Thermoflexaceae bacterium]|nr:DinB family protein [Thermoflexaceae bacterium]